jgi:hypothetical protein
MHRIQPESADSTASAAAPPADGDQGYAAVEGLDARSVEQMRMIEARAAAKTASDYEHIVWAYGVIWAVFAVYAMMLWRRSLRLQADVDALRRELQKEAPAR